MEKKLWKDEKVPSQAYTHFTLTTYSLHMADFSFFKSKLFRSLRWSSDFLNDQFEIWFLEVQFHIMVDPQLVYISAEGETAFIHIRASAHWNNFHPHKTVRSTVPEIIQPLNPLQRE